MMNVKKELACFKSMIAVLLMACMACVAEEAVKEETGGKEMDIWTFNPAKLPEGYPLTLVNPEVEEIKDLLDYERRPLKAVFRNTSGKDMVVKKVLCGCPCLKLAKDYSNANVSANGQMELDFSIEGHTIRETHFNRWILFQVEGFPEVFFLLKGNRITKMRYEPARSINLGTFVGDVDWKRTIKIISDFKEDITLEPLADHPLFMLEVKRIDANVHELTVKPKILPLKTGRIHANFGMTVKGLEPLKSGGQYGPIVVGIIGNVTGLKFALNRDRFTMESEKVKEDGKSLLKTYVILAEDKKSQIKFYSLHSNEVKDLDSYFPVSKEEEEARSLNKLETWEKIAEAIQVKLPEGIKLTKTASERRVALEFEFTPEYLEKEGKSFLQLPVTYQKKTIGTVQIRWR